MSTITAEQEQAIRDYVETHTLSKGRGDRESACSIASINLALRGRLTDTIPACMSRVSGHWIITTQDAMPDSLRNSPEWKRLLPLAAGTGRAHEPERLGIIMDWMWSTVLPHLQPLADAGGYGSEWREMCARRTVAAATDAELAAHTAYAASAATAAHRAATRAARTARTAHDDAARTARTAHDDAAYNAARTAVSVAEAGVSVAFNAAFNADAWATFDPPGLLARLIEVGDR